ncbi:GNAT family N-acetyltransferase [Reinekea forsetii]|nr:GNAT family N-acetyltransferase [Reinekea forsetii]
MNIPVIETERLRLRGYKASDLDAFAQMNSDPEFVLYFGTGQPLSRWDSWNVLTMLAGHWMLRGFGFWIVEEKNTGAFVGRVGIWKPDGWPGTEIGWGISKSHWGKGYATEAAEASMTWAFDNLEIDELISVIHPENEPSKKVAIRIGEKYKETIEVNGKLSEIYAVSRPS